VDFANKRSTMSTKMTDPSTGRQGGGTNVIIDGSAGYLRYLIDPRKILGKYPEMKDFISAMLKMAENVAPGSTKGVEDKPTQYDLRVDKSGLIYRITQEFNVKGDNGQGCDRTVHDGVLRTSASR